MTTVPVLRDHTTAVTQVLQAAGFEVGEAVRPEGSSLPYLVVYDFGAPPTDGPVSDRYADVAPQVLVRAVGQTQASAQIHADQARQVVLTQPLSVPGRVVTQVEWQVVQPVTRDDDVTPPLYYSTDVYAVWTTPT